MGLASELAAATSPEPHIDCDGTSHMCLGRILPGHAIVVDNDRLCTPCALKKAALYLAAWGDPHFKPGPDDIRDAQQARYAMTVALARVDVRLNQWTTEPTKGAKTP
jgi:hypothetical protein